MLFTSVVVQYMNGNSGYIRKMAAHGIDGSPELFSGADSELRAHFSPRRRYANRGRGTPAVDSVPKAAHRDLAP